MKAVLTPENGSNKMGFRGALISIAQARRFQQVGQQAGFERLIAVDRDGQTHDRTGAPVNMMASANSQEFPSISFDKARELTTRQRLHMAISTTRSLSPVCGAAISTERQPSTAS